MVMIQVMRILLNVILWERSIKGSYKKNLRLQFVWVDVDNDDIIILLIDDGGHDDYYVDYEVMK